MSGSFHFQKKHRLRCLYFIHSMFYIQKIEKESDVRAGDKVMLLVDGAGKHAGDKGTITEVVRGGLTIAWEGDYSWGRRPEFDVFTSDEFEFLALGTPEYPWPKRLIVRTRNKKMSEDLDKIVEEEITKEDEQRFYRNLRKDPEALDEERGIRRGGASGSGWQPMMGIDDLVKPCGCKGPCHL